MLEVTYTTTVEDLVEFNTFALTRSAYMLRRLAVTWVVLPTLIVAAALVLWLAGTYVGITIGVVCSGVVIALLFPFIRRSWVRQWARQLANQAVRDGFRPVTLTLTEATFSVRGEVTETTARWEKMQGVVGEDRTYILISDQMAAVVSPAALGDDARYAAVRDFACSKLKPDS